MIEWSSFLIVAVATWVSAIVVITLYSTAVRMRAVHVDLLAEGRPKPLLRLGYWSVFGICGLLVLLGVYLIVPALHGA
ncbi:hypothetical protein ACH82I_13755 [Brevibacterium sp. GP-SGM9]|uniref:hypothetical protein n=1 Tax=unclassified Brevibacterium TaxID=2614124 RepID=UPI001E5D48D9|nr:MULTISPECIES: hypothetical protein [unclassified Brevibacterium]MCD1286522.1 hypothetical protein [Brevibacterium sp. CCUG 69071]MDK8434247.1 hypothetical protein [Brevibacterium sp. H-BE7]